MTRTQQFDCYAAEGGLESGPTFPDWDAAQRWVDDLRDTPWWNLQGFSLYVLRIEVGPATKLSNKFAGVGWYEDDKNAGRIELKRCGLNTRTVLHEVSHVLADAVYKSTGHDPAWARTFLTLVSCVMGPDAYLALQRSYDAHGVDYDAPTSRAGGIPL